MTEHQVIQLLFDGHVVSTSAITTNFGKRNFHKVHSDAVYLSDPQFQLFQSSDGQWNVEHVASAKNETLLNGRALRGAAPVKSGDVITVGNSSKGIEKFPLECAIDQIRPTVDRLTDVELPIPTSVDPPGPPYLHQLFTGVRARLQAVNWGRVGSSMATAFSAVLKFLGTFLGGFLSGMLSGAGSGGGGGGYTTKVHRGSSTFGEVILSIDGNRVMAGGSTFGTTILTIDGNRIRQGNSAFGDVLATVEGESVKEGNSMFGNTIATISGNTVHEGTSKFGTPIATIDGGGRMAGAAAAVFLLRM